MNGESKKKREKKSVFPLCVLPFQLPGGFPAVPFEGRKDRGLGPALASFSSGSTSERPDLQGAAGEMKYGGSDRCAP